MNEPIEVWWCDEHKEVGAHHSGCFRGAMYRERNAPFDCRMVPAQIVKPGGAGLIEGEK